MLLEYFGVGGEKDMTESERADLSKLKRNVDRLIEENKSYDRIEDCPEWARDTVLKLTNKKYLMGDGTKLSLREDMLRIFVILDRIGLV